MLTRFWAGRAWGHCGRFPEIRYLGSSPLCHMASSLKAPSTKQFSELASNDVLFMSEYKRM